LIRSENPTLDTSNSEAFRTLAGKLVALLEQRNGHLVADDYNFMVREFNNAKSKKKK
jgi:hypothetical protein